MIEAESQPFQDIYLSSNNPHSLSIGIVPHIEYFISSSDVFVACKLVNDVTNMAENKHSTKKDLYEARNKHEGNVRLELTKNNNCIRVGEFAIRSLTDNQLQLLMKGFLEYLNLVTSGEEIEDWHYQILANSDAYAMFDEDDPERAEKAFKDFMGDTFSGD